MRYEPKIGKDFALAKELIVAKTQHVTELTRSAIALAVVLVAISALLVTAAICAYRGDFQVLLTLWAVVAAPLGCVIGYYFRGSNTNGQENNTRAA